MAEDAAQTVRRIVRTIDRAALGTRLASHGGVPYVSLVLAATDQSGRPLLLLSALADHTRNLAADPAASLLFDATGGGDNALAGERTTLVGRLAADPDPAARRRFLTRHPSASTYAGFKDFRVFRFAPERAHLVAGFGRIHWLDAAEVLIESAPALAEAEAGIVAHMNQDHVDALQLYATRLLGLDGDGWTMTGLDPEGLDLRRRGRTARLVFERRIGSAPDARAELVRLAKVARQQPPHHDVA